MALRQIKFNQLRHGQGGDIGKFVVFAFVQIK